MKQPIHTAAAPEAIGNYSQAIRAGNTIYLSGQIALDPKTMQMVEGDIRLQAKRVFDNLKAVAEAAGADLDKVVKLTVFLTDLSNLPVVNEVMGEYFKKPFPARSSIGVVALPKGAGVEVEAVICL